MHFKKLIISCAALTVLFAGMQQHVFAADKKALSADELSCSKQARRIHKITDREKKRAFIAKCQADRAAREKAEKEEQHRKKMAKKAKEEAALKSMLKSKP